MGSKYSLRELITMARNGEVDIEAMYADCDACEARIAELTTELARVKAGPNLIQYDDELAAIYRIEDDRAKYLSMDSLCRRLASEADEMLEQTVELKQQLTRVKAESLRVVEDTDSDEWVMTRDGLGWYGADATGNPSIETPGGYHDFTDYKKVRLERWETEE